MPLCKLLFRFLPLCNSSRLLVLACSVMASGGQALAQLVPDLSPVIQQVTDRQADRAQNQAADRAQQQAEAALTRAAERAQVQQTSNVQNQVAERVGSQVERAQAQAAEHAQNTVERVQSQVERLSSRLERAQGQATNLTQQAADRARSAVPPNTQSTVRGVASALQQAADTGTSVAGQTAGAGVGAAADGTLATSTPVRQLVRDRNGNAAFTEITLDPNTSAIEFEWVMTVSQAERQQLNNEAPDLLRFLNNSQPFALTQGELLTFVVPPDLDANDAILQLVPANLREQIDRNHVYHTQSNDKEQQLDQQQTLLSLPMPAVCKAPLGIGMIDSAIDVQHPAFARLSGNRKMHTRSFVDAALVQPASHGTAVASVLVGEHKDRQHSEASLQPLLPNATLYTAAVFHANEGEGQGATLMRVLAALDWLAAEPEVRVINMSLAGPPNRLLAQAVAAAGKRGKVIVAAAGNEGPYGVTRYPAGYDDVVGVGAVARDGSIYRWSNQGPQIDYTALGVAVPTALANGGFGPESGTSIAAPVISAFLACALDKKQGDVDAALASLDSRLRDLGAPGKDPVFGKGLLHP